MNSFNNKQNNIKESEKMNCSFDKNNEKYDEFVKKNKSD